MEREGEGEGERAERRKIDIRFEVQRKFRIHTTPVLFLFCYKSLQFKIYFYFRGRSIITNF
jgi:hypothetical protein